MKTKTFVFLTWMLTAAVSAPLSWALGANEERAVPLRTPPPEYPESLRSAKVQGIVAVQLRVSPAGDVTEATVLNSSDSRLDPLALKAVKRWKFRAARVDDKPIECLVQVPVSFQLEE